MGRRSLHACLVLIAFLAGCSGSGGGGILRYPEGNITVSSYPGGMLLKTSATSPYVVQSAFSVAIAETNFGGPYTITMYSFNNNFNVPCFEPHTKSSSIYTFEPDNASYGGAPNPCAGNDDVETALITDGKGHDAYFTFELTAPIVASVAPTPVPSSSASGSPQAACSQGDPSSSSIIVTGSIQPISFPACNDFMATGSLPANGAANDQLELAISSATQFNVTPDKKAGTPILSLELQPSPSQIAFSDTAMSLAVTVASPSMFGGGTYTMELSENGSVIEEITEISPSSDQISFNVHPVSGVFDVASYVVVIYRN